MEKPVISKHIFRVTNKAYITPHYIRVKLKTEEKTSFDECTLGANNKIFIPPHGTKEVTFASFDKERSEWMMPDESIKPIVRTYTHRAIDNLTNEISIDFINHGDNGPASAWAKTAEKGDQLGVAMKIRETRHYPEVDWYLLVGDATAIPVISCILESLPPQAKGRCIIEVFGKEDIHPEVKHPGFQIQWLFNPQPETGSDLPQMVKQTTLPINGSTFAYVACEYSSVKELRNYFTQDLQWTNKDFYAFSYWKAGVSEEKSAKERREEKRLEKE